TAGIPGPPAAVTQHRRRDGRRSRPAERRRASESTARRRAWPIPFVRPPRFDGSPISSSAEMAEKFEITKDLDVEASPEQIWDAIATGRGQDSWFMGRSEIE